MKLKYCLFKKQIKAALCIIYMSFLAKTNIFINDKFMLSGLILMQCLYIIFFSNNLIIFIKLTKKHFFFVNDSTHRLCSPQNFLIRKWVSLYLIEVLYYRNDSPYLRNFFYSKQIFSLILNFR